MLISPNHFLIKKTWLTPNPSCQSCPLQTHPEAQLVGPVQSIPPRHRGAPGPDWATKPSLSHSFWSKKHSSQVRGQLKHPDNGARISLCTQCCCWRPWAALVPEFWGHHFLSFLNNYLFICLFLAVLGLCCCTGFSLAAASGISSLVAVHRLLIAAPFLGGTAWAVGHPGFSSFGVWTR